MRWTRTLSVVGAMLLAGCAASTTPGRGGSRAAREGAVSGRPSVAPGWEKNHPERASWSSQVFGLVGGDLFADLDSALDAKRFCPNYAALDRRQRATMWTDLVSAVSYFESKWSPVSRMKEPGLGTDSVTGLPVYSEGLLQLSYQDTEWAPYCRFDWSRDKDLAPTDPAKTILVPSINLDCGVRILAAQVRRTHRIVLASGVYWAVLKEGGSHTKTAEIAAITGKLPFCKMGTGPN